MVLDIVTKLPQVLLGRIVAHETCRQPRGGIIDHRNQVELLSSSFQPVVFTGVPLHQFAIPRPPRPPAVHSLHPHAVRLPQAGPDQPLPQRLLADHKVVVAGQFFGSSVGP